jgi:hypothetical protein
MAKLSDIVRLKPPDALSSRYGKAFEKAVFALIKEKDVADAMRAFIEHYGEPHTGAFAKLMKLRPWVEKVFDAEPVRYVEVWIDGVRFHGPGRLPREVLRREEGAGGAEEPHPQKGGVED